MGAAAGPRVRGHGRAARAAGLVLAGQPAAGRVLGDGHGARRHRRRARGHRGHDGGRRASPTLAADPARAPDVDVTLTARKQRFTLASGREIDGYTLDGSSPGPTIRATVGQLVQVRLVNADVPDGVTLHWHGVDVPNAADGVAGRHPGRGAARRRVTSTGSSPSSAGTYWYHSHQMSHDAGAPRPARRAGRRPAGPSRPMWTRSRWSTSTTGCAPSTAARAICAVAAAPGDRARVRVVNTDNGPMPVWVAGAPYRAGRVDGTDVRRARPRYATGRCWSPPAAAPTWR